MKNSPYSLFFALLVYSICCLCDPYLYILLLTLGLTCRTQHSRLTRRKLLCIVRWGKWLERWIERQWREFVEMVERTCSILAVFVKTSALVPRHASDKYSSRALVFSGWSSCDCEKSLSCPVHCNTSCVSARVLPVVREMTVRQIIKKMIVV